MSTTAWRVAAVLVALFVAFVIWRLFPPDVVRFITG